MLLYTLQAIDSFVKLIQVLGGFSRYDIINTETTKDAFLLILSCGRILSLGSPALYYAGTDRLQIVGVGSLHVEIPIGGWVLCPSDPFFVHQEEKPAEERRPKIIERHRKLM